MKNNLISSALIVFFFWYILFLLIGWYPPSLLLAAGLGTLMIWGAAWPTGGVAAMVLRKLRRGAARAHWIEDPDAGPVAVQAGIMADPKTLETVDVPLPPLREPARGGGAEKVLSSCDWWTGYRKAHPLHAQALLSVVQIMQSKPGLPASPEPNGHGGATLWLHSCHVLTAMRELVPQWRYTGMTNSKGVVVVPVQDLQKGFHRFDPADPLLTLAAIAHDIGKVACYEWKKGARVKEVRDNHGTVGAAMLRTVPEIRALPLHERDALLLAVSYYHHPSDMPTSHWIGDLARSLTLLLYEADCLASVREGDANPEKTAAVQRRQQGPQHVVQADPIADEDEPKAPEREEDLEVLTGGAGEVAQDAPEPTATDSPAPALAAPSPASQPKSPDGHGQPGQEQPHWTSDDGRTPLDVLEDLLIQPNAINGKSEKDRIAFKHGEWLYIFEGKMRMLASERLGDPDLQRLPSSANLHKFTLELLRQIDAKGLLMHEFEGRTYSYKRGLWKCEFGQTQREMIIARSALIGRQVDDAKYAPVIVRNFWGDSAALNKRNAPKRENLTLETLPSILQMTQEGVLSAIERTVDGHSALFIELDALRQHMDVNENQLPESVELVNGKDSGKNYLCVRL